MKKLKNKLNLKVAIPKRIEEKQISLSCSVTSIDCSHIIDDIYISGYRASLDYAFLIGNNFTHIINCAGGSKTFFPLYFKEFKYYEIELRDDGNINITDTIVKFISFLKQVTQDKKNKILIHCSEGISRAPALVCSYLMWKCNMDSKTAINFIKEKRKCVDINLGFLFQLENLSLHREILRAI